MSGRGFINELRVMRILGSRFSRLSVAASASLAILCLFYAYTIATYSQVTIYPLTNRVTYFSHFNFYIVNAYIDHVLIGSLLIIWVVLLVKGSKAKYSIISIFATVFAIAIATRYVPLLNGVALISLPAIIGLMVYNWHSSTKIFNERYSQQLNLNCLLILGMAIGIISLAFSLARLEPGNNLIPIQLPLRSYAYDLFLLFSSFSPLLLLLLIVCFPVKMLINFLFSKMKKVSLQQDPLRIHFLIEYKISALTRIFCLSLFMGLSIVIAIIPHLPTLNADGKQVGVDTGYYVNWINALSKTTNMQDFLYQAFVQQSGGDRPLSLLFLYALHSLTGADLFSTVEYVPLILSPALVFVVYFLTREIVATNDKIPLMAAFLTAISFHVLIGIYAGFYANWLALVIGYAAFLFFFRFLKRGGAKNLSLYIVLLIFMLFSHVYTWSILSIATGIFLAVMLKLKYYDRQKTVLLMLLLLSSVIIDIERMSLTGSSGGIEGDMEAAKRRLVGPDQFALRWNNLTYAITTFVGGVFANFIMLGLGLYWLYKVDMREPASIFLIVFLSIGILPFLFGDWQIQTRVFYNIPFQIPAAVALYNKEASKNKLMVYTACMWALVASIMIVANFYLVLPQ